MNLINRIKKLETSLPAEPFDENILLTDMHLAARRLNLREFIFSGKVDAEGHCVSFVLGTEDLNVLREVYKMKKIPWEGIEFGIKLGGDPEEWV
jgi:hypothetical protein